MGGGQEKPSLTPVFLSALVWPGAGQLYNREARKGALLIAISFLVVLALCIVIGLDLARALTADFSAFEAEPAGVTWQALAQDARLLLGIGVLVIAVWAYGVVDAYVGARQHHS